MIIDKPFIHLFTSLNGYYFYDVNKNQIIKINEEIYNILHHQHVSENEKVYFEDIVDTTKIIQKMIQNGLLSAKKPTEILHPANELLEYRLNNRLSRITLQVTQDCNLRCKYCVYTNSDKGKQRKHSNKHMPLETALKGIDFALEHSKDNSKFNVGFYGGEPILVFELIKKCVEYTEKKAEGKDLTFSLTTNGTLLNEEVIEFFEKHNISITISLDGPKEIHDRNRCFAEDGSGTFDVILKKVEELRIKYPKFISKLLFNAVLDSEVSFKCTSEFYLNYETIKDIYVTSTLANNNYKESKNTFCEAFIIESGYELFKSFLYVLGRIDRKNISIISINRYEDIKKFSKKLIPAFSLPDKMHHGGPCIPGELRLFMDVNGNLFPCERVSETSIATKIGAIEYGFNMDQVRNILNIGKITEEFCKNCWAIRCCEMCVAQSENITGLSPETKQFNCRNLIRSIEEYFKDYIALRDHGYSFKDNY